MAVPATTVATKRMKGAGSVLQIDTAGAETPDFETVEGIVTIPQIGGNAEYSDETRIHEVERSYTEEMETPQEFEVTFDDVPGDTVREALIAAAIARETIKAKVIYANGRTYTFNWELIDHFQGDADVGENLMAAVKGRIKNKVPGKVTG